MAGERLPRVLADRVHDLPLGAALRRRDLHLQAAARGEPLLQDLAVVRHRRHEDAGWDLVSLHVQLAQEARDERRRIELLDLVCHPALAPHHTASPNEEHLERRPEVVLLERDDVEVLLAGEHHLL